MPISETQESPREGRPTTPIQFPPLEISAVKATAKLTEASPETETIEPLRMPFAGNNEASSLSTGKIFSFASDVGATKSAISLIASETGVPEFISVE